MVRLILSCLMLLVLGGPVDAQSAAAPAAQGTPSANTATQISPAQAKQVLDVLNDPKKRADFTATLQAIAASLPPPAPAPQAEAPTSTLPVPLAPNSLGAAVLLEVSAFLNRVSSEAVAAAQTVHSVPLLWIWLKVMATDSWAHGILLDAAWRLVLVLAVGLTVQVIIQRLVRRPMLALARQAPNGNSTNEEENGEARAERGETEQPRRRRIAAATLLLRLPFVLARLVLALLPVFGFLIAAHVIAAGALGGERLTQLVLLAVIDAYALYAAVMCIAEVLFSPQEPRLRLLHMSRDAAAYATRWSRRIVLVGVIGYAIAEVGLLFGMSDSAHDALLKAIGLIDHIFIAIIILQQRRTVRRWLRAPEGSTGLIARLRNHLAGIWHWIALAFLAALWLVWAVEIPHGYSLMLRFFIVTAAVSVIARLVQIVALGLLDRMLRVRPDTVSRYPGLEARLALYHPVIVSGIKVVIFLVSLVILLQLWGFDSLDWLTTTLGQRVVSSLVTLTATVILALAVWEAVNASIERHLAKLSREAQLVRSARLRTLLPLLRSTLLITILVVAGMMVLSEIGVNIGPLLAGAGIIGVAIGFGSQKLVQDLITGIFLLLENAMQVGDMVTVSGLTGTVENLSIRTIRLRAGDGSVHLIPFSSVTSVTNVNRGLGNASVNVVIDYNEDVDRVSAVLKEIVANMRKDTDCSAKMLSDLQLWGVDKVDGASVTIAGQVVCTDSGRWSVQRELNRRMKQRFQELGIKFYNPMQTIALIPTPPRVPVQDIAAEGGSS